MYTSQMPLLYLLFPFPISKCYKISNKLSVPPILYLASPLLSYQLFMTFSSSPLTCQLLKGSTRGYLIFLSPSILSPVSFNRKGSMWNEQRNEWVFWNILEKEKGEVIWIPLINTTRRKKPWCSFPVWLLGTRFKHGETGHLLITESSSLKLCVCVCVWGF